MKQRIVFTVINDLNYDQRMIRICSSLQANGYDCKLVGRLLPDSAPLIERPYKQHRLRCFFHKGKLFYLEYNFRLFWYLLFQSVDAICSIDVDTVLPGLSVCRLRGRKHIFDAHELFTDVPEVISRPKVRKVWGGLQSLAFRKTGMAYTVGEAIAAHFESLYGRRVEVVRNMPLQTRQLPYAPDEDKFILYQGALNEARGLEKLIEAMEFIPCRLVLAGEGDLSGKLRQLTAAKNLQHKVIFLGFVLPSDLPALTAKAWIGYNNSDNAGLSYYLSLNNKFFDYIQAGLPSVVNNFPEYIRLNDTWEVGVISTQVVSDIVQNILLLLQDENLHQRLHQNCLTAAKSLNWETEEKHLLNLYDQYFQSK